MKQQEYLQELELGLAGRLPEPEIQDILEEYQGFFADGLVEGRTEDAISEGLGSPARLARTLTEDTERLDDAKPRAESSVDSAVAAVSGFVNKPVAPPLATVGQRIGAVLIDRAFVMMLVVLLGIVTIGVINHQQTTVSESERVVVKSNTVISSYSTSINTAQTKVATPYSSTTNHTPFGIVAIFPLLCLALLAFPLELVGAIVFISIAFIPASGSTFSRGHMNIPMIILALLVAVFCSFYKPIMESLWNGRTVGKRLVGIRVATEDGGRVGVGSVLLRELIGDGLLGSLTAGVTTIVSIFTVAIGRPRKSVPDYIASTIVIVDRSKNQRKSKGKGTK